MRSRYNAYTGVKQIKTKTSIAFSALVLAAAALPLTMVGPASASTAPTLVNGCSFAESQTNWTLQGDCSSTAEINVPAGVTLDGGGYTISPIFVYTDNSNNAALGVLSDNVTIENLTVSGVSTNKLHGINVYEATGVFLNNVTLENNGKFGLEVNGSTVTVNNITTMNNGWGGIDVDLGSGVPGPAVLTVNGTSTQTEADGLDIVVDNTTKDVSVVDTNSQYVVTNYSPAAVYTLKSIVTNKNDCKNGGWQSLRDSSGGFTNQGACVSYVASNGKS